jgi:hypothetical protein
MKKHLVLILTTVLFLSGCTTYVDPDYEPFPTFPTEESIPFLDPHGTVSVADTQPYWTNNNVDAPYQEALTETTADGVKITYEPTTITGLSNKTIQDKINTLIEVKINELKKYAKFENLPVYSGFYAAYPEGKRQVRGVSIWNYASYNSNNVLSLYFDISIEIKNNYSTTYQYDFTIKDSLNIDLNTGEELTLSDLFINGSDYQSALNSMILFKSNNQTDPVPEEMTWYVDTYQYVGGFRGIRGDVKFVLYGDQIILLFNEKYPEFKNDFSTTSISLNMSDLKDSMAINQRFTQNGTDLYTETKISKARNYLYPSHLDIVRETINKVKIFAEITTYDNLSEYYKTLRDQFLADDRTIIANIDDTDTTSMYYSFTAYPNGPYMNVQSLTIDYEVYRFMYATYKPDGTKITFSDVFADGFDYQAYYKNLIKEQYELEKEMYETPLDIDATYEKLAASLMLRGYSGNCYVTLTNEFIQNFSWDPGEFTFSVKITDDASMFKIQSWQTEPY